jgi:hypothetical protein
MVTGPGGALIEIAMMAPARAVVNTMCAETKKHPPAQDRILARVGVVAQIDYLIVLPVSFTDTRNISQVGPGKQGPNL